MATLIAIWQISFMLELVPRFMLPSPVQVFSAFVSEFDVLMGHLKITLTEAVLGLGLSVVVAFFLAILMDISSVAYQALYPILIVSQTIPVIAIAPLLVLWLGYGLAPKVTVVFLVCFFPITVGLLDGFKRSDPDAIKLMKSMGANTRQIFWHIKLPYAMPNLLAGIKVSVSYAVIGAVVAEWLGGNQGLGVYMTRVRSSYSFDKMFAVIFLVSIVSLVLMRCVAILEAKLMPHQNLKNEGEKR